MVWHGYVERHQVGDGGRKRDGAARRLAGEPEAILHTPQDVADWITKRAVELAKSADGDGQSKNGLMVRPVQSYKGVAARGGSAYATVHISRTEVIDLCAEITEASDATGRRVLSG